MFCHLKSIQSSRDASYDRFGSYFLRFFLPSPKTGLGLFALSAALLFAAPLWAINPQIISLAPSYGGVGTSVTISGTYFGTTRGTVKFYTTAATTITNWTASSITVQVPTGATTGPVIVTTAAL
ncbi:MAG TPA: IPT/TIG domain-containing protein [Bryobacteraceae bacterium]|nr:IPT/TIG domain-containing protein [Bryobacteraceae bacterium]